MLERFFATKTSCDVDGITALELDADQLITKVTSVYDSRQLSPARRAALVLGPHGRVAG